MHDVFISYASQDAAVATAVVEALERSRISCWIAPRDVTPGTFYGDEIVHAIDAAKASVLILSQNAGASQHVLREVERAASKGHAVVSLRIDQAPLPAGLEYFLNTSQWLDASGAEATRMMPKLMAAVRLAIEKPATPNAGIAGTPLRESAIVGRDRSQRRAAIVAGSIVAVAIAGFGGYRLWLPEHGVAAPAAAVATGTPAAATAAPAIPEKSVAVLPFVDMSQKKDQEYFSDGLSEELIDRLAHSPDLKVIARTSSFKFKGNNEDVRTIGQRLGVANLLEGSVRTSGKTIRVTAELINASDGSHRWSETYDREMDDVFKVQDSIAGAVVIALKAAIAVPTASVRYEPQNIDAYNAYLRGKYFYGKHTQQDTERALGSFEEATALDSRYADAWVGIAYVHNRRGLNGWIPTNEAYAQAQSAVDHALSIDPNSAAAYVVMGDIEGNFKFDFEKGRAAFELAKELDPTADIGDSEVWDALSAGRFDDGIALSRQKVQRDPLNGVWIEDLAIALWMANRLPEAESTLRHLLELNPSFAWAHCDLGWILLSEHRPEAALAIMNEENDQDSKWCIADALYALGRRAESDALLAEAKAKHADAQAVLIAQSYAMRGDKEQAFRWLSRAYDNRESLLHVVRQDPSFRSLHDDPRFTAFVHKMKLPE
jgi:TolB-like protein/tetratricopeptide (TPR) repeat protein